MGKTIKPLRRGSIEKVVVTPSGPVICMTDRGGNWWLSAGMLHRVLGYSPLRSVSAVTRLVPPEEVRQSPCMGHISNRWVSLKGLAPLADHQLKGGREDIIRFLAEELNKSSMDPAPPEVVVEEEEQEENIPEGPNEVLHARDFFGKSLRFFCDDNDRCLFLLEDIKSCLELTGRPGRSLDAAEKGRRAVSTLNGLQKKSVVTEVAMYKIIDHSKSKSRWGQQFRDWLPKCIAEVRKKARPVADGHQQLLEKLSTTLERLDDRLSRLERVPQQATGPQSYSGSSAAPGMQTYPLQHFQPPQPYMHMPPITPPPPTPPPPPPPPPPKQEAPQLVDMDVLKKMVQEETHRTMDLATGTMHRTFKAYNGRCTDERYKDYLTATSIIANRRHKIVYIYTPPCLRNNSLNSKQAYFEISTQQLYRLLSMDGYLRWVPGDVTQVNWRPCEKLVEERDYKILLEPVNEKVATTIPVFREVLRFSPDFVSLVRLRYGAGGDGGKELELAKKLISSSPHSYTKGLITRFFYEEPDKLQELLDWRDSGIDRIKRTVLPADDPDEFDEE